MFFPDLITDAGSNPKVTQEPLREKPVSSKNELSEFEEEILWFHSQQKHEQLAEKLTLDPLQSQAGELPEFGHSILDVQKHSSGQTILTTLDRKDLFLEDAPKSSLMSLHDQTVPTETVSEPVFEPVEETEKFVQDSGQFELFQEIDSISLAKEHDQKELVQSQDLEPGHQDQNIAESQKIDSRVNFIEHSISEFSHVAKSDHQGIDSVASQIVEQSQMHMSRSVVTNDTSFTIRLDPPELGEVIVRLKKSEGGIVMRVAAVEPATQTLLQTNETDLSQSMSEYQENITMEFGTEADFTNSESFESHQSSEAFTGRQRLKIDIDSSEIAIQNVDVHNFTA